ncbi:A/G-specific adenine glycosylase [Candidatus Palauibacter sp.]|uniref:A/G-specific adenine glycosylase n=1 Tax=Candidatus Palauibacter sp. TaxID=3101350 RepID=UPI003B01A5F6
MASSPKPCSSPDPSGIAAALLDWFDGRRRDVPWRGERDPYPLLVAEVMAQQTRLDTAIPFHRRFMARFPDVRALAAADEDEVLKLWEGLGYYARARNLRRAAQVVVAEYGGRFPDTASELRRLPGVGPYTAGALASLAFGRPEPAIDGNARRVLSRLHDLEAATPSALDVPARSLLQGAPERPGALNQALMDLGSAVCTPRRPQCGECPVSAGCLARRRGTIALRPPARVRARPPTRYEAAAVVLREGRILVLRRPATGLLGGLWDFPSFSLAPSARPRATLAEGLRAELGLVCRVGDEIRELAHAFSHFRLRLALHSASWLDGEVRTDRPHRWATTDGLAELAFPVYQRRFIDRELRGRQGRPGS